MLVNTAWGRWSKGQGRWRPVHPRVLNLNSALPTIKVLELISWPSANKIQGHQFWQLLAIVFLMLSGKESADLSISSPNEWYCRGAIRSFPISLSRHRRQQCGEVYISGVYMLLLWCLYWWKCRPCTGLSVVLRQTSPSVCQIFHCHSQ